MRHWLAVAGVLMAARATEAQLPVQGLRLDTGIGVDTTARHTAEIVGLLRSYLTAPTEAERAEFWSAPERQQWPMYDLLGPAIYIGNSHFTVLEISPAVGLAATFGLRVLISSGEPGQAPVPLLLYRVFAVRENGHWVLANALPRLTRSWGRKTAGRVTFWYPPGHAFNRARAAASAVFVDSLAAAYSLPRPEPIAYYFSDDLSETLQAFGLDLYPFAPDTIGGRSNAFNRQVFVGLPTGGEGYRHELAHVVLHSLIGPQTSGAVMEGLMTWVGGRAAVPYRALVPSLNSYLAANPGLTLETIVRSPPPRMNGVDPGYDGMAVLCQMVFDVGGVPAIRSLLASGRDPEMVLDTASRLLGLSRTDLSARWRARIGAAGAHQEP